MCNRHVAHVLAEDEPARLDEDGETDEEVETSASHDAEHTSTVWVGLLAEVRTRLAR